MTFSKKNIINKCALVPVFTILMTLSNYASASGINLITNGDFSSGDTGFSSQYQSNTSIVQEGMYAITTNPFLNHGGAYSYMAPVPGGHMMAINGGIGYGQLYFWAENINTTSNASYLFSISTSSWSTTGGAPYDSSPAKIGVYLGDSLVTTIDVTAASGVWTTYSQKIIANITGNTALKLVDLNTSGGGNDFAVTNISVSAVPLPAALPLFASAIVGFGALARRRTRKTAA